MIPAQCHVSLQPLFTSSLVLSFFFWIFFLLKHPFPISLSEVCSSSHLQFSRVVHRHLLPPALSPGGSCPSSGWFPAHHRGLTSPWWDQHRGILSAGPGALQTKQAAPSQAQFIRGGWTWTSTLPAFLRQGPYKNYEHCMVMKISLEIDALHWIAIAASKDHLQLVLEIKREESEFSPVAICLWTCIKSGQTPGRVPASFMYNNLNQLNTSVIPKKIVSWFKVLHALWGSSGLKWW